MNFYVDSKSGFSQSDLLFLIQNFSSLGEVFIDGNRNKIKIFEIGGKKLNIKSFKEPNFVNRIAYKYFRKSKARRSFEHANMLIENGIGTPKRIAYFENSNFMGIKDSYYISEHLLDYFTFREFVNNDYSNKESVLRQFTRFTYQLHQRGIEFLDHSSGNTLIKLNSDGQYSFYLVDLNRMKFHKSTMSFKLRMKNMCMLTSKIDMIEIISNEYAKLSGIDEKLIFTNILHYTENYRDRYKRKSAIKKKLKFWESGFLKKRIRNQTF